MRSQLIHFIHNFELFIESRALSSRPKVIHVNQIFEQFISSTGICLLDPKLFI